MLWVGFPGSGPELELSLQEVHEEAPPRISTRSVPRIRREETGLRSGQSVLCLSKGPRDCRGSRDLGRALQSCPESGQGGSWASPWVGAALGRGTLWARGYLPLRQSPKGG